MFLGGLMDRLKVTPEIEQFYEFKSAAETFKEEAYTPAAETAMLGLANSVWNHSVADIAADRKMQPAALRALLEASPYDPARAVELKPADKLGYPVKPPRPPPPAAATTATCSTSPPTIRARSPAKPSSPSSAAEDSTLLWLDKKGNMLNRVQFPYRPSIIGGMDENFVFYICGTLADHAECSAVSKGAKDPKWTLPLEESVGVSGVALTPQKLYVATEEGVLYAIGDD